MTTADEAPTSELSVWEKLVAPFPTSQIEKLPKQMKKDDQDRGSCKQGTRYSADGHFCGGYHARSIHLDYVGHAGITMRLNEAAGPDGWNWQPAYHEIPADLVKIALENGQPDFARYLIETSPALYTNGGLWIELMICGVTKLGFGDAAGKTGPNAVKEIIGDALRNGALRFGVGTYLWSKSEYATILRAGGDPDADDSDPDYSPPIGVGESAQVARLAARSEVRRIQTGRAPMDAQPPAAEPEPSFEDTRTALEVAERALVATDADELRRTYAKAEELGLLRIDVSSKIPVLAVDMLKIQERPVRLGTWLIACGQHVKATGTSVVTKQSDL